MNEDKLSETDTLRIVKVGYPLQKGNLGSLAILLVKKTRVYEDLFHTLKDGI
jgi:hypothetical protein